MKLFPCLNCKNLLKRFTINLPSFTHFNFELIDKKNTFYICDKCNLISKQNLNKKNLNFFNSKGYYFADQNQKSFNKKNNYLKHEAQFDFLQKKKVLFKGIKVLDIGCNNGDLISLIKKDVKNSICKGYDKNPFLKKNLIKKKLFFDYRKNKTKKFDLIIMSHSLIYFKDLKKIIEQLVKNLSKNGIIFIENSNFSSSPFYLLMSDQFYFFTPFFLQRFFLKYQYFSELFYPSALSGNFVMLFSKRKNIKNFQKEKYDFYKSINYLIFIKKFLISTKKKVYFIFGTTVKAAFLNFYLGKKVVSFADESLVKNSFLNKKVIHPKTLKKSDLILVPLKDKKNILKKLNTKYEGKFSIL